MDHLTQLAGVSSYILRGARNRCDRLLRAVGQISAKQQNTALQVAAVA